MRLARGAGLETPVPPGHPHGITWTWLLLQGPAARDVDTSAQENASDADRACAQAGQATWTSWLWPDFA